MKLVVLERNSVGLDTDVSCFQDFGEVAYYPNSVTEEEIAERVKDADIIIANKAAMNERTLENAKNVKLIAEFATGYDNCDLEYCKSRRIRVTNTVDYCTPAVAQHTFALAFYVLEKLHYYDTYVKSGTYGAQDRFSNFDRSFYELEGKTWGIIGMGNIGRKVAKIAKAFGCRVIFYSISGKSQCNDYERVDFDTLLKESDILSLHCPLTKESRYLIDYSALQKMKSSAVLVNVARGAVVNNKDLAKALEEGLIAGAGLDVLEQEPIAKENPLNDFKDSDKLIITPHMAWASIEARKRCVLQAYENVKAFLEGREANFVV